MKKRTFNPIVSLLMIGMTSLLLTMTGCNDKEEPKETEIFTLDENFTITVPARENDTATLTEDESTSQTDTPLIEESSSISELPESAEVVLTDNQRPYRTMRKGDGSDVITLMIYLCGSDLESQGGAATVDLAEIIEANISDNINIIVETGGANEWANDLIDPNLNQRWLITNDDIELLESSEAKNMSEGSTLSDFISYSASNFPADRYMLVLWDHGGGTIGGYAFDERFSDYDMMSIAELDNAFAESGVVFDFIGFDSCLMATAETAFVLEKYADYMIASQRVEPGSGWHYTPFISGLSENTSMPTNELGELIVDSYIASGSEGYYGKELTLSVIDLTYIPDLFQTMNQLFAEVSEDWLTEGMFLTTSKMLGTSRAMQKDYDLVDLSSLAATLDGSEELLSKLEQCVVYNGTTIDNHNGLCLYFPYTDLSMVQDALAIYQDIGLDEQYQGFITAFANTMLGGQAFAGGSSNPLSNEEFDINSLIDLSWADEEQWSDSEEFYEDYNYDTSELAIEEKGEDYVLSMTDEDWELITAIEQQVFLDDGEGYIELGYDSMYEFDDDGDLLIEFDNTWVSLDGQLVCFYTTEEVFEDDYWYTYGIVPIYYEDEYAELVLMWDTDNPYGYVAGWRYSNEGSGSQKGLYDVFDGMTFDFLCDFYTYDGEYEDQYFWGGMTVDGEIEVTYEDVGDGDVWVYYALYDVYNNIYWTEPLLYSYDIEE